MTKSIMNGIQTADLRNKFYCQEEVERELMRKILTGDTKFHEKIMPLIDAPMFCNKLYRELIKTAKKLYEEHKEFDDLLILENCQIPFLKKHQVLAEINAIESEYICRANYKYYVKLLSDYYFERLYKEATCSEDIEKIKEIEKKYSKFNNVSKLSDKADQALMNYFDSLDYSITTGYSEIDNTIGSIQGGDFIILAGATGMGKTCMMLNLIKNISISKNVLLFSLEMRKEQLQNRIVCADLGLDVSGFRKHNFKPEELNKYCDYVNKDLDKFNLNICDDFDITVDNIKEIIIKNMSSDIIFIDYLGLINGDKNKSNYEKFGEISRELKMIAVELNKPIIALHQLNRSSADRKDKKPKLSDLRDSGKIEQDADMIFFVYRPAYYDTSQSKDLMEFMIGKNRHGESGKSISLCYNPAKQKISDRIPIF